MDKFRSHRQKRISQKQEKHAAEDVGGKVQAGSGNVRLGGGGDVRKQGTLRIECKYTEKSHFDLKLSELRKIQRQALRGGLEIPVMQLEFVSDSVSGKYAILPALSNGALPQFKSTTNKQVRLHRDELLRALLEGPDDGIQVTFLEEFRGGYESVPHTFTIMNWRFFFGVEEGDPKGGSEC